MHFLLSPSLFGTKRNGDTVTLTDARSFIIRQDKCNIAKFTFKKEKKEKHMALKRYWHNNSKIFNICKIEIKIIL